MGAVVLKGKKNASGKPENEREEAYRMIKDLILAMHIKPGEAVTETALSIKTGIGRTPVREALKMLEQEGLIVTNNRRKSVYMLTVSEIEEIFDLKICIESAVVKWAAENRDEGNCKQLEKLVVEMKELAAREANDEASEKTKLETWLKLDGELHSLIFEMAGNKRAGQIIKNLNAQWHRLRVGIYTMEGRMEKAAIEHERFVLALIEGEALEAESGMRSHLENLKRELVKILKLFHFPYS